MSESDAVRSELESPHCTRAMGRNTAEEKEAHATEGPRAVTGPRSPAQGHRSGLLTGCEEAALGVSSQLLEASKKGLEAVRGDILSTLGSEGIATSRPDIPKRIKSRNSKKYLHTHVHGSIIQNSQQLETQVSSDGRMHT